jgi:large subunit ribosomal protein L25
MARQQLNAEVRGEKGKGGARQLRREGWVPAILYGGGGGPRNLRVSAREMDRLFRSLESEHALIGLKVGNESHSVLIREVQHHPTRGDVLHVDFHRISETEKIRVEVPVSLTGVPVGVKDNGGILEHFLREVMVECLPKDLPEHLQIDISHLNLMDTIHVSDIVAPGIAILDDPTAPVCVVSRPSLVKTAEEEAAEAAAAAEEEGAAPAAGSETAKPEEKKD